MDKKQIIKTFNPSQAGALNETIFGLPFDALQSEIIIIPMPWEVTVSYGGGTSNGPEAILEASYQVDLCHQEYPELWKLGIYMDMNEETRNWKLISDKYKIESQNIIKAIENGMVIEKIPLLKSNQIDINTICEKMNEYVKNQTLFWLNKGKKVALLGGDHSTPLGYYQALATKHDDFGILHIDAHMDLRIDYEGFTYSHASIMFNALKIREISKIVQIGIRDFCNQEVQNAQSQRVSIYSDMDMKTKNFKGVNWDQQCEEIIASLPQKVTVSIDVDGLESWNCPSTGTPVPGGISFDQTIYLLSKLAHSNKEIIGFDLVEVAHSISNWDGNVGARLLYHMCGMLAKNNGMDVGQKIIF